MSAVLISGSATVAFATDISCFPNGFCFTVYIYERWPKSEHAARRADGRLVIFGSPSSPDVTVAFSDGRWQTVHAKNEATDALLVTGCKIGGTGGWPTGAEGISSIWVSPLPPDGPVTITLDWPGRDLAGTTQLDGTAITRAAERAVRLWDR